MSVFLAFALLLAAEQILLQDVPWYSYLSKSWPIVFCFFFGMAGSTNKILKLVLLPLSAISACILISSQLPWDKLYDIIYAAALLAMSVFIYILGLKYNDSFPSMLTLATIIIYLAELLVFGAKSTNTLLPLNICAIVSFIIGLYNFNSTNLKSGVHNAKGGASMAVPAGLRGKNILMLTGFLIVALLISNFVPIDAPLKVFVMWIIRGIWKVFVFFGSSTLDVDAEPTPTPEASSSPDMVLPDIPVNPYAHVFIIVFISIIIIMFFLGIILMMKTDKEGLGSVLRKLLKRNDVGQLDLDFEEDVEKIFKLRDLLKKRRRDMSGFFERLFKRQERFEDMPDNRMKVRFTYKTLLKKSGITKGGTPTTPMELSRRIENESVSQLARDYSEAKYGDTPSISDKAAENAKLALTNISRSKVKDDNDAG